MRSDLPVELSRAIRDRCVCLHLQRATRAVSRRFDRAFAPLGITNQQYTLMVSLNRPMPSRVGQVTTFLAMDRTTLTAALKPLERRGLVKIEVDPMDRRGRLLSLTPAGEDLLAKAVPIWRATHDEVDQWLAGSDLDGLRGDLKALGSPPS